MERSLRAVYGKRRPPRARRSPTWRRKPSAGPYPREGSATPGSYPHSRPAGDLRARPHQSSRDGWSMCDFTPVIEDSPGIAQIRSGARLPRVSGDTKTRSPALLMMAAVLRSRMIENSLEIVVAVLVGGPGSSKVREDPDFVIGPTRDRPTSSRMRENPIFILFCRSTRLSRNTRSHAGAGRSGRPARAELPDPAQARRRSLRSRSCRDRRSRPRRGSRGLEQNRRCLRRPRPGSTSPRSRPGCPSDGRSGPGA